MNVLAGPTEQGVRARVDWPPLPAGGAGELAFYDALRTGMAGDALDSERQLIEVAARYPGSPYGQEARRRLTGDFVGLMAAPGVIAAVAIPAFMKYIRRFKTAEARMSLRKLFDSSVFYCSEFGRFPPSAPLTPPGRACVGGDTVKHAPTPDSWRHPTWRELNFAIDDPHYYQYEYVSDGQSFTARALGDLNCDGVLSTFERIGHIDADGNFNGGAGLCTAFELE